MVFKTISRPTIFFIPHFTTIFIVWVSRIQWDLSQIFRKIYAASMGSAFFSFCQLLLRPVSFNLKETCLVLVKILDHILPDFTPLIQNEIYFSCSGSIELCVCLINQADCSTHWWWWIHCYEAINYFWVHPRNVSVSMFDLTQSLRSYLRVMSLRPR